MMPKAEHKCLTCRFAKWNLTVAGRLHPSGDGRCTWVGKLPRSVTYRFRPDAPPEGGHISRRRNPAYEDCPTYEPAGEVR